MNKLLNDYINHLKSSIQHYFDLLLGKEHAKIQFKENLKRVVSHINPHTYVLLFVPKSSIDRVVTAFKRLFDNKENDNALYCKPRIIRFNCSRTLAP